MHPQRRPALGPNRPPRNDGPSTSRSRDAVWIRDREKLHKLSSNGPLVPLTPEGPREHATISRLSMTPRSRGATSGLALAARFGKERGRAWRRPQPSEPPRGGRAGSWARCHSRPNGRPKTASSRAPLQPRGGSSWRECGCHSTPARASPSNSTWGGRWCCEPLDGRCQIVGLVTHCIPLHRTCRRRPRRSTKYSTCGRMASKSGKVVCFAWSTPV
jgi:hypothetical protein